jgi:hypothetical protein
MPHPNFAIIDQFFVAYGRSDAAALIVALVFLDRFLRDGQRGQSDIL